MSGYWLDIALVPNCRHIDGFQRIDIPMVQDWLASFGVVPAA